jgi:hypothetical protein
MDAGRSAGEGPSGAAAVSGEGGRLDRRSTLFDAAWAGKILIGLI